MRITKLLALLLLAGAGAAQTPVGLGGAVGKSNDFFNMIGTDPIGDTWYTSALGANSLIAAFPGSWPDTSAGALPLITVLNDGSAAGCGAGNIIYAQLSKLPAYNVTPSSANTHLAALNCMSSFGPASAPNAPAGWSGQCTAGDGGSSGCTWKGAAAVFYGGKLAAFPYRQDSPGSIWGEATGIGSADAAHAWIDYERYHRHTATGASCSANVVTLIGTNTMASSGIVYVHGVSPSGYNGMHTVTGASGSQITYSVTSCPGAYVSGGQFGPMATDGSAPVPPSDPNYSMMWPVSGGKNPMSTPIPISWGQDGSYPTPADGWCDPAVRMCGYSTDKVRHATPQDVYSNPVILWSVDVGPDLFWLEKANYHFYTCAGYSTFFPSAEGVCDINRSNSWGTDEFAASPIMILPRNGAGNAPRECFTSAYSPTFKSYTMGCLVGSTSQYLGMWAPHPQGPFYPLGGCQGGGTDYNNGNLSVPDGACGHDGAFAGPMAYGEVQTGTTPPSSIIRMSSGGCCFHVDKGSPLFWNLQMNAGILPETGAARRNNLYGNIGYRFVTGNASGALSRRGPGYALDWWFDLWDHGGNTDTGGRPFFRDLMNPSRYLQVLWDDGPTGSNYSHAISLDTSGPTFGDSSYTQRLQPNFTDSTVGGGSGNNSWSAMVVIKPSVINYAQNKILYLTHNNGGDTPDVQIQVGGPGGSGAACVVWSAGSFCTPTGVVPANAWSAIWVVVKFSGSGFPVTTIYVSTGGVTSEYGGADQHATGNNTTVNSLTKLCSSCSSTPNITTGGTWWIQNRPGGNGSGSNGTTSYGDLALYAGAVPGSVVRRALQTMITEWNRVGRGLLGPLPVFSLVSRTNTQAVIAYTAPDSSACTIEVSTNGDGTYRPLVYDVDPSLFSNADQDNRSTSIFSGTSRKVVIGQRTVALAADSKYYSRALQAYTAHYWRATCTGGAQQTGSFTTTTIPWGMTYQDFPQLDKASPGDYIRPTLSTTDPNQEIIDPYTGVKITRVGLPADFVSHTSSSNTGPYLSYGGFPRLCSDATTNGGTGILCAFYEGAGDVGAGFFLNLSTHRSAYLGRTDWAAYPEINTADGHWYGYDAGTDVLSALVYNGGFTRQASGTHMPMTTTTVLTGVTAAFHAFNSSFDPTHFGCGLGGSLGDYSIIGCTRNGQDSYGWVFIVQDSTGTVVAGTRMDANIQTRWCGMHNQIPQDSAPSVFMGLHGMLGDGGSTLGHGPFISTIPGNLTAGATSITVSGEPDCAACGADPELAPARVGDHFKFIADGTNDEVVITAKADSTHWTITPLANNHTAGASLAGQCTYPVVYWNYLQDPNGTDATGTKYVKETHWPLGGHDDAMHNIADPTKDYRITESDGWVGVSGDILSHYNIDPTFVIPASNTFGGAFASALGVGARRHPAKGANTQQWFVDHHIWDKVPYDATLTPVSGQVYKYHPGSFAINPRYLPVASAVGNVGDPPSKFKSLLDVSPAVLGTTSADQYKMCVANAPGECFSGSAKGEIYVNVPGSPGNCGSGLVTDTPCLANFNAWTSTVVQVGIDGQHTRGITGGLLNLRDTHDTASARALPDGSGILFQIGNYQRNTPSQMMLATLPPYTAPTDSVDRTKFVAVSIPLTAPNGLGVTRAALRFGYAEFGTPGQYRCTSRAEGCIANYSGTPPADGTTDPFKYETSDMPWTGIACATSCSITLPVLPMHVVYYQAIYLNAGGTIVSTGPMQVTGDVQ